MEEDLHFPKLFIYSSLVEVCLQGQDNVIRELIDSALDKGSVYVGGGGGVTPSAMFAEK